MKASVQDLNTFLVGSLIPFETLDVAEPGVLQDFLCGDAFVCEGEYSSDEFLGLRRHIAPVIVLEGDVAVESELPDFLEVVGLEGKVPAQHEVKDDPQTEGVYLLVELFHLQDLGSHEARSASKLLVGGEILKLVLIHPEAEVYNFDSFDDLLVTGRDNLG